PVRARGSRYALLSYGAVAILWPFVTLATHHVNPDLFAAFPHRPLALLGAAITVAGLVAVFLGLRRGRDGLAFLGSTAFLAGLLASCAAALYPVMLRSTGDPALSLTAPGSAVPAAGLRAALRWWIVAFPLAIGYLALLFRLHRGRAIAPAEG